MKKIIGVVMVLLVALQSMAAPDLELPPEELAKETVLPVFDRPEMVRMRKVKTAKRWEFAGNYSWAMSEPIFNTTRLGLSGYYHLNEERALGVQFYSYSTGLSDYAKQLRKEHQLDYNRAPKPQMGIFGDYNMKLFYGKMSVAKNSTINTHLQALFSLGMTQYESGTYPGGTAGVGYKFYFTPNVSLRTDLRLFIHQAPIPFKKGNTLVSDPAASKSSYKERIHYTNILDVGLSYLF